MSDKKTHSDVVSSSIQSKSKAVLADRLNGVSESATLKLNALVGMMKAKGLDIVNLTAGEPDFFPPEAANSAILDALKRNQSKYTPVAGIPELREAVAEKTNLQQPSLAATQRWKPSNVVVSNGAKQAIFNSFLALINPGDEVLIPSPYWLSYPEMVKIAGGIPKIIECPSSQEFKMTPKQLEASITSNVKIVILNSPSNPTGMMYSQAELSALGQVFCEVKKAHHVWVFSDEIYDRIVVGQTPFCSFLEAEPRLRNRTITFNGLSKSCAMTGWRVGWSVAGEEVTQGLLTLQGQSTSGVNSLAQWASVAALKLPETFFSPQIESFRKRRNLIVEKLKKNPKIDMIAPEGAFYLWVGIRAWLKPGEDSVAFAQKLLEEAHVAVVPGTVFGAPEFIRLSFATDDATLEEACRRILQFLAKTA